jgi:hypothetical protein
MVSRPFALESSALFCRFEVGSRRAIIVGGWPDDDYISLSNGEKGVRSGWRKDGNISLSINISRDFGSCRFSFGRARRRDRLDSSSLSYRTTHCIICSWGHYLPSPPSPPIIITTPKEAKGQRDHQYYWPGEHNSDDPRPLGPGRPRGSTFSVFVAEMNPSCGWTRAGDDEWIFCIKEYEKPSTMARYVRTLSKHITSSPPWSRKVATAATRPQQ